ncbi:3-deoxy-manno-octulosonate-8-phosphatase KdsC [Alginatibacterium sediminis]|uniref:3-deoxy-D-manno-octulosonate 8-phosphate phosphatase KdsC n=1 Tax=Alginatibacterium sediminis TaxID=2164068 RepID=A0A420E9D5_9ALTE|nr:3-deoxy-manno-octulosonate-8-phosphatase KdsC [Alginatibacterium sediminis]RKF15914.1 3-deoxy-manno-octulosonate-8-phosphatase KdsC [Alginatibacterium sediminis]
MLPSLYGPITTTQHQALSSIKLLICDVDGVFSDGRIYMGNQGEELKAFHTKDGFGIKALLNAGIQVAIITGRQSKIVENRMSGLGIKHIFQGQSDKTLAYEQVKQSLAMSDDQCAYIGDDVVDLPVMRSALLGVAVQDAHPLVLKEADYTTRTPGGFGAVRELCDLILWAQGQLEQAQGMSV